MEAVSLWCEMLLAMVSSALQSMEDSSMLD